MMVTITLSHDSSEIERATAFLETFFAAQKIDEQTLFQFNLCLEELLTNIMTYAAVDANRISELMITLSFEYHNGCLRMTLEDNGYPFNPLNEIVEPDLDAELDERKIGGLGIHLVKTFMDTFSYTRQGDCNRLELEKQVNMT